MSEVATSLTVDFGSTFTKVRAVGPGGEIFGATQHRTTIDSDVLDGMREALRLLEEQGVDYSEAKLSACSSAGGGLWMGVVGLIENTTSPVTFRTGVAVFSHSSRKITVPASPTTVSFRRSDRGTTTGAAAF